MATSLPSLLKPEPEPRYAKFVKYAVWTAIVGCVLALVLFLLWLFVFRFHAEEAAVTNFMDQVSAGHYEQAYKMWGAGPSYRYSDFLQDWGEQGYYGPVRSFRIVATGEMRNASGAIVVVDVSPFRPFPSSDDPEQDSKTKQVRLWVQFSDHSISYAP